MHPTDSDEDSRTLHRPTLNASSAILYRRPAHFGNVFIGQPNRVRFRYQRHTKKILHGDSSGQMCGEGSVGRVTKKISEGQSVAGGGGRPEGMGT